MSAAMIAALPNSIHLQTRYRQVGTTTVLRLYIGYSVDHGRPRRHCWPQNWLDTADAHRISALSHHSGFGDTFLFRTIDKRKARTHNLQGVTRLQIAIADVGVDPRICETC